MTERTVAGLNVSRETWNRLEALEALLAKWNPAINLVSKSTIPSAWERHIVDSAQIYRPDAQHWADLGSGAGFPGLVVAVICAELQPTARVTLVEADQRKATFLRQAARTVGIQVSVLAERIERVAPLSADVLSARALAPLDQLLAYAKLHLSADGTAIFPKGAGWKEEVDQARQSWRFDLDVRPSITDPAAVILTVRAIEHV